MNAREEHLVRGLAGPRSRIETRTADWKELVMQDVIFLAVTILFFAVAVTYVVFCERVR